MHKLTGCDYGKIEISLEDAKNENINQFLNKLKKGNFKELVNRRPTKWSNENESWILTKKFEAVTVLPKPEEFSKFIWGGYVGRIRDLECNVELHISSRLDGEKCYFLSEMVQSYINREFGLEFKSDEMPVTEDAIFDFLKICIFRNKLMEAYESGWFKRYTYFRGNDAKPKGRIDIARHIRLNGDPSNFDHGRIAYENREHTVDNEVNHLILRTWVELRKALPKFTDQILTIEDSRGRKAESILMQMKFLAPSFMDKSLGFIVRKAEIPVTNELYSAYESLRKTCIDILTGLSFSLFEGNNEETKATGMLFYMPDLWEIYLQEKMEKICEGKGIKIYEQEEADLLQGGSKKITWVCRPDFVIKKADSGKTFIFDAKFKPGWDTPDNHLRSDVMQLIAYGEVFDAAGVAIIFPFNNKENRKQSYVETYTIGKGKKPFLLCGLCIPDEKEDYAVWLEELNKQVKILSEKVMADLSKEKG